MKKNFVKVVFFGALALSTVTYVGCKDYDDDVKNLQEQIDKINAKEPGVSTEAMNSAIQSAVASLKSQLETAISGKADNASVQALQTKVNELVAALEGKADASKITELVNQISALSTEVNNVKGSLDEAKANLETKIASLEEQIAKLKEEVGNTSSGGETPEDTSLREQLNKLTADLATAQNELARIEQATKDNAGEIVKLAGQIGELNNLKATVEALEAAHANFAQKGDLDAYYTKEEIAGLIDTELTSYMTSEEVAAYVDEIVNTTVLTKITAINERLDTFNEGLSKVSEDFAKYCQDQSLAYNQVIERIKALEDYKSETLTALEETVKGQGEDLAQALLDIKALSDKFAGYATTSALEGVETSVKAYVDAEVKKCTDELAILKGKLENLEIDVDRLKKMIQSITFVPEYTDGTVQFSALILKYQENGRSKEETVGETNNAVLTFRVSPATAAAKFADFYDISFDEQPAKTRGVINESTSIFSSVSEPDLTEAAKGIIRYTVTISAKQSYVVCLNVTKKDAQNNTEDKDYTDINSNYFPVVYKETKFDKIRAISPQASVSEIIYNDPEDVITYSKDAYYETQLGSGQWTKLEGFDLSRFGVVYEKKDGAGQATDAANLYELDATAGTLRLTADAQGKRGTIGKKVTVSSIVNIKNINSTTYQVRTANAEVTAKEKVETVKTEFNLGSYNWEDVVNGKTISLDMVQLCNAIGYSAGEYSAGFSSATETQPATSVSARFTATTAEVTIDPVPDAQEAKELKTIINFAGTERKLEVTIKLTINTPTDAAYKLKEDSHFLLKGEALFNPSIPTNALGVVTGQIGLTKDLKELFTDYATTKNDVYLNQGKIEFIIVEPLTGEVNLVNDANNEPTILEYDPVLYTGSSVKVRTSVTFGNKATDIHEYNVNLEGADKLSGTWMLDPDNAKKEYTINNENKTNGIPAFNGYSWVDGRDKVMWKDGSQVTNSSDFTGVEPLAAYYLSKPTFKIEDDPNGYFIVNAAGKVELTQAAHNINGLAQAYTVTVKVLVKSPWGVVAGTEGNTSVEVTIPKGFTY